MVGRQGSERTHESWLEDERDRQEYLPQYNSWLLAIPPVLGGLKEQMDDLKRSGAGLSKEMIEESHLLLEAAYPDAAERTRVLLRWFGSGSGKMTGFPSYEKVPEQFLAQVPIRRSSMHSMTPMTSRSKVACAI